MSTSQGGAGSFLLYAVVYVVALGTVYDRIGGGPIERLRRPAPVVAALWLVVAVPSLLSLAWQPLLNALERDPDLVRSGELWRLATSAVVQDDGATGTAYNLVTLALTLPAAAVVWGGAATAGLFVAGALAFDLPAVLLWPEAGAGNSGATSFLATSMLGAVVATDTSARRATGLTVVAGVALLVLGDAHGEAVLAGLVVGLALGHLGGASAVRPVGPGVARRT